MMEALEKHITENNILDMSQHGFRKKKSTSTNLVQFWEKVTDISDSQCDVSIIYTDFMKAFDSVPHDLLLLKLEQYGITGRNLDWFRSYLNERTQKVIVKDQLSEAINVESGIPQGGVLSGTLFALYINDVVTCFKKCEVSLYADDAKIFYAIENNASIADVQEDLDNFSSWCDTWRIKLNVDKCFFLHHGQRIDSSQLIYKLNGIALKREKSARDLGVIISDDLKWHLQTDEAVRKSKNQVHIIRRTFKSRNAKFLTSVYKLHVCPHMEYCVEVWNPYHKGDIEKLEKVQNMMTRLLPFGKVMSPSERNSYMNLPTHEDRRIRGDLIRTYQYIDNPQMFTVDTSYTRTGNGRKILTKYARTDAKKYCLSGRTTKNWNNLSRKVVEAENVNEFKRLLDEEMKWP